MKKVLLIGLLFCSFEAFGQCAAHASGSWTAGGTWDCGHAPTSTDNVTIGAYQLTCNGACDFHNLTMTTATGTMTVQSGGTFTNHCTTAPCVTLTGSTLRCESGATCNLGSNENVSDVQDIRVNNGANLLFDNGSTFNWTGSIVWTVTNATPSRIALNGHSICNPNGTDKRQRLVHTLSGLGTNSVTLEVKGQSWSSPAVFETKNGQIAGGHCTLAQASGGAQPKLDIGPFAILNQCGDTTNACITEATAGAQDISLQNVLLLRDGLVQIITNNGVAGPINNTFAIDRVDIRLPNAATNYPIVLNGTNTTVPATSRIITNVTCESPTPTLNYSLGIRVPHVKFGLSIYAGDATNTPGLIALNCPVLFSAVANSVFQDLNDSFLAVRCTSCQPGLFDSDQSNSGIGNVFYFHGADVKSAILGGITNRGQGHNIFKYNLGDGDYFYSNGLFAGCGFNGPCTITDNIAIHGNLALISTQQTSVPTVDHNLAYHQPDSTLGQTTGAATSLVSFRSNVVVWPQSSTMPSGGICGSVTGGLTQVAAFVSLTTGYEDNNLYYGFANTTDHGASTCTPTNTGGGMLFTGIFNFPSTAIRGGQSEKVVTSTSTGPFRIVCSSCDFAQAGNAQVRPNDVIFNGTARNQFSYVVRVENATTIDVSDLAGLSTSNVFTVLRNVWANDNAIGSTVNHGLRDIHATPNFYNPDDGVCTYYNRVTGAGLVCPTATTTDAPDTNLVTIMHDAIKLNGWDYGSGTSLAGTNCASNCPQRVAPIPGLTAHDILAAVTASYRLYNGMASHAGHDGTDIGPRFVPVYPAAIIQQ